MQEIKKKEYWKNNNNVQQHYQEKYWKYRNIIFQSIVNSNRDSPSQLTNWKNSKDKRKKQLIHLQISMPLE